MDEKTFRPERRPIQPSEVQAKFAEVSEIRQAASIENAPQVPQNPLGLPDGVVKGNIPQELLDKRLAQVQQNDYQDTPPQQTPNRIPSSSERNARSMGAKIDSRLSDVLAKIQPMTAHYDEIVLPSNGIFYDGTDGPKDGKLNIRPMTGREEEILATQRYVKRGEAIDRIFRACIRETYNTARFLVADRTFLLIYLRGISYTPQYDVELRCPECDTRFSETFDLDTLFVEYCSSDFGPESLKGIAPVTKLPFIYRLPRGDDDKAIQEYQQRRKQFDTSSQADDTLLYRTACLLEEIDVLTDTPSIFEVLKNLPVGDVAYIRNQVNDPPFGLKTNVEVRCNNCASEFDVDIPLEANFFFPKMKRKETPQ
jgi:hypothetical protein